MEMRETMEKVKVHGVWASPFSKRVEIGLKIKGVPYEYVEEDLCNKSEMLLHYNPVYKKVPVLVHEGRPIVESLVILEYIDEIWREPHHPNLLPLDPYQRAKVRFWSHFIHQELFLSLCAVILQEGEEQEKAVKEFLENLSVVEEGLQKDFYSAHTPFSDVTASLGFLEIVLSSVLCPCKAYEETSGFKLIDPQRNPLIFSWVTSLSDVPVVKETLLPNEKLAARLHCIREKIIQSPKA